MADKQLSAAVVVYIWGQPRTLAYPSAHPDDMAGVFGDHADSLVHFVRTILAEAYAEPMFLAEENLSESAARIERVISSRHPELDHQAVTAVGTHFAYNTK